MLNALHCSCVWHTPLRGFIRDAAASSAQRYALANKGRARAAFDDQRAPTLNQRARKKIGAGSYFLAVSSDAQGHAPRDAQTSR